MKLTSQQMAHEMLQMQVRLVAVRTLITAPVILVSIMFKSVKTRAVSQIE